MKTIKLKICNANLSDKFSFGNFFLNILKKYYKVELTDRPDYVIYNDSDAEYLKYKCVRIMFTGENYTPNFNLCDYAIGCDYLDFQDRFYRLPVYAAAQFYSDEELALAGDPDFTKPRPFNQQDLAKKTGFCSFVYSNYLADPPREEMFNKLSAYKKVDAGGAYLNNIGGRIKNKLAFEMAHKFSIAFENSSRSGYTTEKLPNALVAGTVPVYWGNPDIHKEFNPNRFINCHAYKNFDEVAERVKEIDNDDNLYLKIINEPALAVGYNLRAVRENFEKFLCHIFDQPLSQAKRRTINTARAAALELGEAWLAVKMARKNKLRKVFSTLYSPFKKSPVLDRLKQKIMARQVHKN